MNLNITTISLFILVLYLPVAAQERQNSLQACITLANNSSKEKAKEQQITRIVANYHLTPWWFTNEIVIDEHARSPFSHPKLTLTAFRPNDDLSGLSQLLHEQIHWFEQSRKLEVNKTIDELKLHFPNVQVGYPDGARDEFSTYLHLAVCLLELDAMTQLLGKDKAESVIATNGQYFYKWIYKTVLQDQQTIRTILMNNDFYI